MEIQRGQVIQPVVLGLPRSEYGALTFSHASPLSFVHPDGVRGWSAQQYLPGLYVSGSLEPPQSPHIRLPVLAFHGMTL
jgi:hypothetical protein